MGRFSVAAVLKNNFGMQKLALTFGFLVLFLFVGWPAQALPSPPLYYNTSSANMFLNLLGQRGDQWQRRRHFNRRHRC